VQELNRRRLTGQVITKIWRFLAKQVQELNRRRLTGQVITKIWL